MKRPPEFQETEQEREMYAKGVGWNKGEEGLNIRENLGEIDASYSRFV